MKLFRGGARGADSLAEKYANQKSIPIRVLKPNWAKYSNIAGLIRNTEIVDASDKVIAFWDGKSKGTWDSINKATKQNKDIKIIRFS